MRIDLLCPSRGRPEAARELLASFDKTKTQDGVRLVFCVDSDDRTIADYPEPMVVGAPTGDPTGPLNRAALLSVADIVGFIGDDSRCETEGWDRMALEALKTPGFCWGFDGTAPDPRPTTIFVSRPIVKTLGYLALPTLKRGFFDVVWVDIAKWTGMARVISAMFSHDNSAGDPKSPNFRPEAQVPSEVIAADEAAYKTWRLTQAEQDIRKVRALGLSRFF